MTPREWSGMGHRIASTGGVGGEEDDNEERSGTGSTGNTTVNYTVEPDGEVTPIGGEEEEEGGEPEEGEGGEAEFPPLTEELDKVFKVHDESVFFNNPDLPATKWNIAYVPPSGATYLVLNMVQMCRVSDNPGSGFGVGLVSAKLGGKAPDAENLTTAGGLPSMRRHVRQFVWINPKAGNIEITLESAGSPNSGQAYLVGLPISVFGGLNTPKADAPNINIGGGPAYSGSFEIPLPAAWIYNRWSGSKEALPHPPFTNYWNGFKCFRWNVSASIGSGKFSTGEIMLGIAPTQPEFSIVGAFPVTSGYFLTAYGNGVRARLTR